MALPAGHMDGRLKAPCPGPALQDCGDVAPPGRFGPEANRAEVITGGNVHVGSQAAEQRDGGHALQPAQNECCELIWNGIVKF